MDDMAKWALRLAQRADRGRPDGEEPYRAPPIDADYIRRKRKAIADVYEWSAKHGIIAHSRAFVGEMMERQKLVTTGEKPQDE